LAEPLPRLAEHSASSTGLMPKQSIRFVNSILCSAPKYTDCTRWSYMML